MPARSRTRLRTPSQPHDVARTDAVGALRTPNVEVHRVVVLPQADDLVAAANRDAEVSCVVLRSASSWGWGKRCTCIGDSSSWVRSTWMPPNGSLAVTGSPATSLSSSPRYAVAQQVEDLAADAAGFGDLADSGEPFQHKRFDPGQTEFGGERQTRRPRAPR